MRWKAKIEISDKNTCLSFMEKLVAQISSQLMIRWKLKKHLIDKE